MEKRHQTLQECIQLNLNTPEDSKSKKVFEDLKFAFSKGYLTRDEFLKICLWKSPRPKKHYLKNTEETIQKLTRLAFETDSEELKLSFLTSLSGVSIPVASAILTITNPKDYGVIDIRVWQTLYLYGEVNNNSVGKGFRTSDWINYLTILRKYAIILKLNVRDIERILFFHHREIQEGNLYSSKVIEQNH